jgi:hypothetical protein
LPLVWHPTRTQSGVFRGEAFKPPCEYRVEYRVNSCDQCIFFSVYSAGMGCLSSKPSEALLPEHESEKGQAVSAAAGDDKDRLFEKRGSQEYANQMTKSRVNNGVAGLDECDEKPPAVVDLTDVEARQVYCKANGFSRDRGDLVKLMRATHFQGVISVIKDNACAGLIIGGEFHKDQYAAGRRVLAFHKKFQQGGFSQQMWCIDWIKEALFPHTLVIDESEAEVSRSMPTFMPDYHRPEAKAGASGVTAEFWVLARDSNEDNLYRRVRLHFDTAGRADNPQTLQEKSVMIMNRDLVK